MMLGFWALIVWAVVSLVPRRRGPGREILDARLARGEISVEDYRRMRDEMSGPPAPGAPA
jgi:uncharacterized membrane protein